MLLSLKLACSFPCPGITLAAEPTAVDYQDVALREHLAACVLAEEPYTVEIGVDYCLPEFFRVLGSGSAANGARVVDQDVDGAELLDRVVYEHLADGLVAY